MKKLVCLIFLVLLACMLAACTKLNLKGSSGEMINPGDKVGDFMITTGEPGDVTFFWELDDKQGKEANTYFTEVAWGTKLIVSAGIYDDTFSGKLDENWSNFALEMYIEDRPVNLAAFGTIESHHPMVGTMRHYNVLILADKPGKITIHQKTEYQGETDEWYSTYTFLPPE